MQISWNRRPVEGALGARRTDFGGRHAIGTTSLRVWLGCRLTGHKQQERFRGEMDELFIADRGLEPQEIVALMKDNRLSDGTMMTARSAPSPDRGR